MLRFECVVDVETNTAATAQLVRDEVARALHALETERGWRVRVWEAQPKEREP